MIVVVGFCILVKAQFPHYQISSGSMSPSLVSGDFILVNSLLKQDALKRNDVCVFSHSDEDYISRIIGFPGDKVQLIDGVLFVNDQKEEHIVTKQRYKISVSNPFKEYELDLTVQQADAIISSDTVRFIRKVIHPKGYEYKISDHSIFPNHPSLGFSRDNFGPIRIPAKGDKVGSDGFVVQNNYYFAMGDNRAQSVDSRYLGLISECNLVGKMMLKLYSASEKN